MQGRCEYCEQTKEIVDEYVKLGIESITIRPLTKLGKAESNWESIGYTAEEFLEFYQKALDYIIQKNNQGYFLKENILFIYCNP